MDLPACPVASPTVVLREEFDDWAVLFDADTAAAVGTNPVGVVVWKLLDGRHDLEQIVAEVRRSFADVPETVADDVQGFLARLAEKGFVGREPASL
jgi:SynChlorMet cassette protein ScmD